MAPASATVHPDSKHQEYISALLYTTLDFILTHSISDEAIDHFLNCKDYPIDPNAVRCQRAQYVAFLLAAVATITPARDISAAFEHPLPSSEVIFQQANLFHDRPRIYSDTDRQLFRCLDYDVLEFMRQSSRQICLHQSGLNLRPSKDIYRDERSIRRSGLGGRCLYALLNGTTKLVAIDRCLSLIARLIDSAFYNHEGKRRAVSRTAMVRRHFRTCMVDEFFAYEGIHSGPLRMAFEVEKTRLLALRAAREAMPRKGPYLWPRWGNPRPKPLNRLLEPLEPPALGVGKHDDWQRICQESAVHRRSSIESGSIGDLHVMAEPNLDMGSEEGETGASGTDSLNSGSGVLNHKRRKQSHSSRTLTYVVPPTPRTRPCTTTETNESETDIVGLGSYTPVEDRTPSPTLAHDAVSAPCPWEIWDNETHGFNGGFGGLGHLTLPPPVVVDDTYEFMLGVAGRQHDNPYLFHGLSSLQQSLNNGYCGLDGEDDPFGFDQ